MAAVNFFRAPVRTLPEHCRLQTEAATCRIPTTKGNTEEWETVVEHSPDSLGSSPDNPVQILSDDDDENRSDDGFPSLSESEIAASNTPGTLREPGAPVTPGISGGLEARPDNVDDAPLYDGTKGDSMAKSLPKTQGTPEATVISEDEDEDEEEEDEEIGEEEDEEIGEGEDEEIGKGEDEEIGEEEDGEVGEEEEDDYQLDAVYPLEANAFGALRRGQGVSSAGVTDLGALENPTESVYVSGQSSQANSQDRQQSIPRPKAHIQSQDSLFITPGACSSVSSLNSEDDEGDAANGQNTEETSGTECSSPIHLPPQPKNKPRLSSRGRRAQAIHRVNGRARGDGRKSNRFKRKLQPQVADSDSESTWDNVDENYSPLHMEVAPPQHKRRKVSSHLHSDTVPSRVRHTRKRLATRESSRRPAADSSQARYDEWPVHNASLRREIDAGTAVFQHHFDRDLLDYRKTYAPLRPD